MFPAGVWPWCLLSPRGTQVTHFGVCVCTLQLTEQLLCSELDPLLHALGLGSPYCLFFHADCNVFSSLSPPAGAWPWGTELGDPHQNLVPDCLGSLCHSLPTCRRSGGSSHSQLGAGSRGLAAGTQGGALEDSEGPRAIMVKRGAPATHPVVISAR